MPAIDSQAFEDRYGCSAPLPLLTFLNDDSVRASLPAAFILENVGFALEIQYLLDIENPENYDASNKKLTFAMTTDGLELLVDLTDHAGDIYQDEFGDIDHIGISMQDLVSATRRPLG